MGLHPSLIKRPVETVSLHVRVESKMQAKMLSRELREKSVKFARVEYLDSVVGATFWKVVETKACCEPKLQFLC